MTSQHGKQTVAIHILPNIPIRKGNETIKLRQLVEYKMRNNFLEKSHAKCWRETSPRSFSGKPNWAYLWINRLKFYRIRFYCMSSWGLSKYIDTNLQTNCRSGYSVSKRLLKLTSFKSFPLQLSGYQDISLLSFVRVASSTLIRCGWVFINARSVQLQTASRWKGSIP